tara:strand:+ start:2936 stop:3154 length:219 start_codon:yes stop_codon:yes gene_type:complete
MRKQGNHMVDLPQPELDYEEECEHVDYDILGVHDYDEATIVFEVRCRDCGTIGYIEGSIKLNGNGYDVEWIE